MKAPFPGFASRRQLPPALSALIGTLRLEEAPELST
jgi:hypothetical protein